MASDELENLVFAGKNIAQSFYANAAARLHPTEWNTGVAAGYGLPSTMRTMARQRSAVSRGRYFYRGADTSFTVLGFVTSDDADASKLKLFDFERVFVRRNEKVNVSLSVSQAISIVNGYGLRGSCWDDTN